jgi:hypothetical protein
MLNHEIYSILGYIPNLAAAGGNGAVSWNFTANLNYKLNNKECYIKSILWTHKIFETVTGLPLPIEMNNTQVMEFQFPRNPPATNQLTNPFTGTSGTIINNGFGLYMWRPGFYPLGGILLDLNVFQGITVFNYHAALAYSHTFSFLYDIEY